jgi:tetratricopeptide (TPR) repeat protein
MSSKIVARGIVALVLLQAGVAYAQQSGSDTAIAQSLFDEGRKLMNEKRFVEACPRLERSYKLDPAAGTLLNLAVCHEGLGKTATAWNEFRESVAMAKRENRKDRVAFAQAVRVRDPGERDPGPTAGQPSRTSRDRGISNADLGEDRLDVPDPDRPEPDPRGA